MTFFVRHANGQRYGPVDEADLAGWAREGRLTAHCELENAITHEVIRAYDHAAVRFALPPGTAGVAASTSNPRAGRNAGPAAPGQSDYTLSLVFGVIGLLTCYGGILLGPLAIWFGYRAGLAGRPPVGLFVLGVLATCLGFLSVGFAVWLNSGDVQHLQNFTRP